VSDSEIRDASQRQWSSSAASWARAAEEEETGAFAAASAWMLEAADLRPGDRVIELACGAGQVGLQAAAIVGPDGAVLCSDFSEAMVEAVRERVGRLGATNVTACKLDAERLDLEEAETDFDVALCRFGYMLMPDPAQALRETARVLRPGGRVALAVWGTAEGNPWLSSILNAVMAHLNAPPPKRGDPGPFALGSAADLRAALDAAELPEVQVDEIAARARYESLDAWWERSLDGSGPLAAVVSALPSEDQEAIRAIAMADARRFEAGGGVEFPAAILGAGGRRPT
jgi:SAM-dependent methyltransferase